MRPSERASERERQRERRKGDQTGKREARPCDRGRRSTGNMRRRAHSRHSRENERARRAARSRIARTHVIAHALAKNVLSDRYLANSLDALRDRVSRNTLPPYLLSTLAGLRGPSLPMIPSDGSEALDRPAPIRADRVTISEQ